MSCKPSASTWFSSAPFLNICVERDMVGIPKQLGNFPHRQSELEQFFNSINVLIECTLLHPTLRSFFENLSEKPFYIAEL